MSEKVLVEFTVDSSGAIKKVREFKGEVTKSGEATKKASSGLSKYAGSIKTIGAAVVAAKVIKFMRDSVNAAAEQQATFTQLAASMATVGVSYNEVGRELQSTLSHLQEVTKYGDTDTAAALQRLVAITGDYTSSLSLLGPTLDFASAMNIDLATASRLVGQAVSGNTGALSRYGIILDDATKAALANADGTERAAIMAELLTDKFGGSAAAALNTYSGRVAQLGNYWGDFKEALGDVLVKSAAAPGVFTKVTDAVKGLVKWAQDLGEFLTFAFNFDPVPWFALQLEKLRVQVTKWSITISETIGKIPLLGDNAEEFTVALRAQLHEQEAAVESWRRVVDDEFDEASDAANEFRDAVENVALDGLPPVQEAIEDTAETINEKLRKALGDAVKAMGEAQDKLHAFAMEGEELFDTAMQTVEDRILEVRDNVNEDLELEPIEILPDAELLGQTTNASLKFNELMGGLSDTFADTIGKGFVGELGSFAEIWEDLWSDLAKGMTAKLSKALLEFIEGGGKGGLKGLGQAFNQGPLGAIAGLGGVADAYKNGDPLGGAMSGAMAGASLAGPIGALVGAVVGGLAGLFGGGGEDPNFRVLYSDAEGYTIEGRAGFDEARGSQMERTLESALNEQRYQWTQVLRTFGKAGLFDLLRPGRVGEELVANPQDEEAAENWMKWALGEHVPSILQSEFKAAFNRGMKGYGMSAEARDALWGELNDLVGSSRLAALNQFVTTLVGVTELLDAGQWSSLQDALRQDTVGAFVEGLGDVGGQMDLLMTNWDNMSLLDRAKDVEQIGTLFEQAMNNTLQMLAQIDAAQKQITDGWAGFIEDIRLQQMTEREQMTYFGAQIRQWFNALSGADTLEGITDANANLMEYVQNLAGMVDLSADLPAQFEKMFGAILGVDLSGQTWGEVLEQLAAFFDLTAQAGLEDVEDEVQTAYQELVEKLELARDGLVNFTDVLSDPASYTPDNVEANVYVDVRIGNENFDAYIDARAEMKFSEIYAGPATS